MSRSAYQGWRYFICDRCGTHWRETCRDHSTLSGGHCPAVDCGCFVSPYKSHPDAELKVDRGHNLLADEYKQELFNKPTE